MLGLPNFRFIRQAGALVVSAFTILELRVFLCTESVVLSDLLVR